MRRARAHDGVGYPLPIGGGMIACRSGSILRKANPPFFTLTGYYDLPAASTNIQLERKGY
jgi:hypothetical protein